MVLLLRDEEEEEARCSAGARSAAGRGMHEEKGWGVAAALTSRREIERRLGSRGGN
jgi:hypothetical protein